jgi:hypothetical protein
MKKQQKLIIGVEQETIFIELYNEKNDKLIDRERWQNDGSSSERLLGKIDVFLKENGMGVNELSKVSVNIDENQKYTLARIIETVANTINYCLSV